MLPALKSKTGFPIHSDRSAPNHDNYPGEPKTRKQRRLGESSEGKWRPEVRSLVHTSTLGRLDKGPVTLVLTWERESVLGAKWLLPQSNHCVQKKTSSPKIKESGAQDGIQHQPLPYTYVHAHLPAYI